jgi:4-amino-4-deoxy-L-arabinose transferase-like glycosyltransferase
MNQPFNHRESAPGARPASSLFARPNLHLLMAVALLLTALGTRLYRITDPPLEFHPTRQYIGAIVARGYYFQTQEQLPEWRRQIARINHQHQELLEPQVLPFLSSLAYRMTGGERLWIPRVISILCWLAGGILVLAIARQFWGMGPALAALAVYLLLPYGVLASRVIQPDPMMVMLMLVGLYLVLRYHEAPSRARLLQAAAVSAVALLVKPVCIFILMGAFVALQFTRARTWRALFRVDNFVFGGIMLAPAAAYYLYGIVAGGFIRTQTEGSFLAHLLIDPAYWSGWLRMIGRVTGFIPLAICVAGWLLSPPGKPRLFLSGMWAGYFVYGLVFNYHIHTHDYYSLPLIPMAALSFAALLDLIGKQSWRLNWTHWAMAAGGGVALLAAAAVIVHFADLRKPDAATKQRLKTLGAWVGFDRKVFDFLRTRPEQIASEIRLFQEIGGAVEHRDRTVFLTPDYGKSRTYHGEFAGRWWPPKGKAFPGRSAVEDYLNHLIAKHGLRYFIITDFGQLEYQPELREHLVSNYPLLHQTEAYWIFDLARERTTE